MTATIATIAPDQLPALHDCPVCQAELTDAPAPLRFTPEVIERMRQEIASVQNHLAWIELEQDRLSGEARWSLGVARTNTRDLLGLLD